MIKSKVASVRFERMRCSGNTTVLCDDARNDFIPAFDVKMPDAKYWMNMGNCSIFGNADWEEYSRYQEICSERASHDGLEKIVCNWEEKISSSFFFFTKVDFITISGVFGSVKDLFVVNQFCHKERYHGNTAPDPALLSMMSICQVYISLPEITGLILGFYLDNERRRYKVMSLICWVQT